MSRTWASVRFQVERYHRWPDAPNTVAFLRNLHRHMFHVEVRVEQHHDDRDVEYILLRRLCVALSDMYDWQERTSCEDFARYLQKRVSDEYGRAVRVSVHEDGENGAIIEEA